MQAPNALMLSVLVSSMNSDPNASVPRTKMGTCKRMRGERLVEDPTAFSPESNRQAQKFPGLVLQS
jgi:hypothetical protein